MSRSPLGHLGLPSVLPRKTSMQAQDAVSRSVHTIPAKAGDPSAASVGKKSALPFALQEMLQEQATPASSKREPPMAIDASQGVQSLSDVFKHMLHEDASQEEQPPADGEQAAAPRS